MPDKHGQYTVDKAKIKDIKGKAQLRKVVQNIVVDNNYRTSLVIHRTILTDVKIAVRLYQD